jgi:CheY-like chemotaxis protein
MLQSACTGLFVQHKRRKIKSGTDGSGRKRRGDWNPGETVADDTTPNILLIDDDSIHAQQLAQRLRRKGLLLEICHGVQDAMGRLRQPAAQYDLVIVNVSDPCRPWGRILRDLREASYRSRRPGPLFLCVSQTIKSPQLRLRLEQGGARLAYER